MHTYKMPYDITIPVIYSAIGKASYEVILLPALPISIFS